MLVGTLSQLCPEGKRLFFVFFVAPGAGLAFNAPMISTAHDSLQAAASSRRQFLHASAAALLGALACPGPLAAAAAPPAKSLVGSNVYGWTQYAARDKQPFDLEGVLSALRDSGYDYLENFMDSASPDSVLRYAAQCRAKGLAPVSLYSGARLHDEKAGAVVKQLLKAGAACKEAGFQVLSCNPDPIGREKTGAELATQASALTDLGRGLKELGIALGIHHHMPELKSGGREFHHVLRNTPECVGLCYDVHWVWKGGISPAAVLKEYAARVVTWHIRQSRQGVWIEDLDTGDVDYAEVAREARARSLPRRFTVELALEGGTKVTNSAVENHRRSREFIRRVFEA